MTCETSIHRKCHFVYHIYFIRYYLHLCLKKLKFETDGTYNMIAIKVGGVTSPTVKLEEFFKVVNVSIPFDFERYEKGTQQQRYSYYMELFEEGLTVASEFRPVPLKELKNCLKQLEEDNFVCRWDFKTVSIKELGLKVKFHCQLTTYDFKLIADVYRKREPIPFCGGTVIRTKPDSIHFNHISRDIPIRDNSLRIQTKWNEEYFYLPLQYLLDGKFTVEKCHPRRPEDKNDTETFYHFQRRLQYDNDEFC